ncbi:MAG: hypothetical protein ACRENP_01660 [Longimicrobiales bacterium]
MVDGFQHVMGLMVMRIAQNWIRADATHNVAVRVVVRRRIRALIILRVIRDQVGEQERSRMLQIAQSYIRVADGVVQPIVVGKTDHVVVERI